MTIEESLSAREAVVAQREANVEWLGEQQEALARQLMMASRAIKESQETVAAKQAELDAEHEKHGDTRRLLALERERGEMARQVKLGIQRLIDAVLIWRAKGNAANLPAGILSDFIAFQESVRADDSRTAQHGELLKAIRSMSPDDIDYLSRLIKGEIEPYAV